MKLVVCAFAASLAAGTAVAGGYSAPVAESPVIAPVVETPVGVDWTGFYTGLQYGVGDVSGAGPSTDFDAYGLHAGYLWDRGSYVLGAELDYNKVDLDGGASADLYRLRGRLGADLGRFMPYATLGLASISGAGTSDDGMTYGIGADYLLSDRFSLGLEYSRNSFDNVAPGVDADADMVQLRAAYRF